jgi:hypothetical protein
LTSKINFGPIFKHKNAISASKCKTLSHCSQKYYCSYHLKLPEKGNSGSQKGDVVHRILELLCLVRRKPLVAKIQAFQSCRPIAAVWYLVEKYADEHGICVEEELALIDKFILTALNTEFLGPDGEVEIVIEKPFDFEVVKDGISYRVRGFIDKFFILSKGAKKFILLRDYKTNKKIMTGEEVSNNIQSQIYELAINYLYPEHELTDIEFIFLAFPKKPSVKFPIMGKAALYGLEMYLTDMQVMIDNFSEKNIGDNLGILKFETKFLCGPAKSGWICPAQRPMNYAVLLNQEGEILASGFTKEELQPKLKDGLRIEERFYSGCIHFHDKEGKPRRLTTDF